MGSGVRVELRIDSPEQCPVVDVAAATGGTGQSVTWSEERETGRTVEEFVIESPADDPGTDSDPLELPVETVFTDASSEIYRFDRDADRDCPCVSIEQFGCPIADVEVREDALFVTFHVAEMDDIRPLLTELRSQYDGLSVERLIRSEASQSESSLLCVDRDVLTDRQIEVLRTALEMGYFERPRDATAGEVAEELGINRATFAEHLAAAQRKLLPDIVGRRGPTRER